MNVFDTEPFFVNELGVKWWHETECTNYARNPDSHGTTLAANCYYIEKRNGYRTRVLVSQDGSVIGEHQALDAMGERIDLLKFLKREGKRVDH